MELCAMAPGTPRMTALRVFKFWTSSPDREFWVHTLQHFRQLSSEISRWIPIPGFQEMTGTSLHEQGDVPTDLPDDGDQNEEVEDA